MGTSSELEFGFEVGWNLICAGMAVIDHASLSGIGLVSALGLRAGLHLKVVGNGIRLRVLVAEFRGEVLRRSTDLNPRQLKT